MTWGEFKEKMQQRGVTDDTPIDYIVIDGPRARRFGVDVTFATTGEVRVRDV